MTLLFVLDFIAEVCHMVFQLGVLTRKYLLPALVAAYVAGEIVWEKVTSFEMSLNVETKSLKSGLA